jgi:hypothetical protein
LESIHGLNLNTKNIFYSRGEWGHVGHVPGATSSITDGGDEEKNTVKWIISLQLQGISLSKILIIVFELEQK